MEASEAIQTVVRGQNGLLDPAALNPQFMSRLFNVDIRDGLARTRPSVDGRAAPVQGRFQGLFEYRLEGVNYWVLVVAGQVWVLNTATDAWTKVGQFPTIDFDRAYFVQADRYGIVQNGIYSPTENWPIIFHGVTPVDNLETEYMSGNSLVKVKDFTGNAAGPRSIRVPIGKSMAFGHGRLFVAVERYYDDGAASQLAQGWRENLGLRFWMAGNILQSHNIQSILVFSDMYFLSEGLAFSLPTEMGFITSMAFMRNAESGTGLGALIIFARRGAAAFAVNMQRKSWLSPGFGQILFTSSGTNSPWAVAQVNSDLVYYGDRGLRTLKYSASNEAGTGGLASVGLSPEVTNFTQFTDPVAHGPFVSFAHADNYLFFTAGGFALADGSVAFSAVLPWDLASFQVSGEPPNRVFSGAWGGDMVVHAVATWRGEPERAGVMYRETETGPLRYGPLRLKPATFTSAVVTAAYAFKEAIRRKRVKQVDAIFDEVTGPLTVWFRWRYDGGEWEESEQRTFSGTNSTTGMFRIPVAVDDTSGFLVQFSIEWRGHARLKLAVMSVAFDAAFSGGVECDTVQLPTGTVEAGIEFPSIGEAT